MIVVLFVEMLAGRTQNAPLREPYSSERRLKWLTKSPGAIWDAGTE
jgi:hypothetical protein